MDMDSVNSTELFTIQKVRKVLEDIIETDSDEYFSNWWDNSSAISATLRVPPWHGNRSVTYFESQDRKKYVINTCEELRRRAADVETHVLNIDSVLSSLLECRIYVRAMPSGTFEDDLALRAYRVLKRLPWRPLKLADPPEDLDMRYFWDHKSSESERPAGPVESGTWSSLRVTAYLSPTIIKMALYIVIAGLDIFAHLLQDYPNMLAELLDVSSDLTSQSKSSAEYQVWYIVRSALWSSWQRSSMLYYYALLKDAFQRGFSGNQWGMVDYLRSTNPNPGVSIHQMSSLYAAHGKAQYMCSWAFELLRTELSVLAWTFEHFINGTCGSGAMLLLVAKRIH